MTFVYQYLKTPDEATLGGNKYGRLMSGEIMRDGGVFFLFFSFYLFLYHIFVVKVQEIIWSVSYGENENQNPKLTNKGNIRNNSLQLGSGPVPGPHTASKFKQVTKGNPP